MTRAYLRLFLLGCLIVAVAPAGAAAKAPRQKAAAQTVEEKNKAIVKDFMRISIIQHRPREGYMKYVAPGYIQHNPSFPDGRDATIAALEGFMAQVPGMTYEIKHILADGDLVVLHAHLRMTPEDRGSAVADIFRLKDGMIIEHWDVLQPIPEKAINTNTMF